MNTVDLIATLIKKKGITEQKFLQDLQLNKSALADWRKGTTSSYTKHIQKIADYFNVSVDYLLGRVEKTPSNIVSLGKIIKVPVIGRISAHYNGGCNEEVIDEIDIPESALRGFPQEDCYFLRVNGNSMYPEFIDGDIVTVLKQSSVDSGTVAAILYDGESATLKKVEYIYGQNWLKLVPRNPEFETKLIEGNDLQNCTILGRVISLVFRPIN